MGSSLALSCNIRSYVIDLDYGFRYLLKVCSELSDIYFLIWLHYHLMFTLHDRPVIAMVNILALELYQLLQYSYVCSSVMSDHPEGGGSARNTSVDMVSRLAKSCWICSRVWYGFISSSLLQYSVFCNRIRLWLPISARSMF